MCTINLLEGCAIENEFLKIEVQIESKCNHYKVITEYEFDSSNYLKN